MKSNEVIGTVTARRPNEAKKQLDRIKFQATLLEARSMVNREEIFFAVWKDGINTI